MYLVVVIHDRLQQKSKDIDMTLKSIFGQSQIILKSVALLIILIPLSCIEWVCSYLA